MPSTKPLGGRCLSKTEKKRLENYLSRWNEFGESTESINVVEVKRSIGDLYNLIGRDMPEVIFCASPWQMVLTPVLLQIALAGEVGSADRATVRTKLGTSLKEGLWPSLWSNLDAQLDALESMPPLTLKLKRDPDQFMNLRPDADVQLMRHKSDLVDALSAQYQLIMSGNAQKIIQSSLTDPLRVHLYNQLRFHAISSLWTQIRDREQSSLSCIAEGQLTRQLRFDNVLQDAFEAGLKKQAHCGEISLRERLSCRNTFHNTQVATKMGAQLGAFITNAWWASWMASDLAAPAYLAEIEPFDTEATEELNIWIDIASGASGYLFFDQICFVCERPLELHVDDLGRLHNRTGPALKFKDGYAIYCWHGLKVSSQMVNDPKSISTRTIDSQANIEVRRLMIELYGQDRYLLDSGARVIAQDGYGILYIKDQINDEPLVMVKVTNATAEPDGSFKEYFIRVPPHMVSPKQAVAWTFEQKKDHYRPSIET